MEYIQPELYCLCRGPSWGWMIACDGCDDWFHGVCIGLTEEMAPEKYYCPRCAPKKSPSVKLVLKKKDDRWASVSVATDSKPSSISSPLPNSSSSSFKTSPPKQIQQQQQQQQQIQTPKATPTPPPPSSQPIISSPTSQPQTTPQSADRDKLKIKITGEALKQALPTSKGKGRKREASPNSHSPAPKKKRQTAATVPKTQPVMYKSMIDSPPDSPSSSSSSSSSSEDEDELPKKEKAVAIPTPSKLPQKVAPTKNGPPPLIPNSKSSGPSEFPKESLSSPKIQPKSNNNGTTTSMIQQEPFSESNDILKPNSDSKLEKSSPNQKSSIPRTTKKQKKKQDPNKPRRPPPAYIFFSNEQRARVSKENPTLKFTEVSKKLGDLWKSLSKEEKRPYEEVASKDFARFKEEMKHYVPPPDEEEEQQETEELEATETMEDEVYEVESISKKRYNSENEVEYLVRWEGLSPLCDTWEPASQLASKYQHLIDAFESEEAKKKLQPSEAPPQNSNQQNVGPNLLDFLATEFQFES